MHFQFNFLRDPGYDIQTDNDLELGWVNHVPGPDRAFLLMPFPDRGTTYHETLALWILDEPAAGETLAAALGVPDPRFALGKPWYVHWIKDGQWHVKERWIGVDRGVHLLTALADYDVLDRRAQLFGGAA